MTHRAVKADKGPAAVGPYNLAVVDDQTQTVYVSGQIPLDPASGELKGTDVPSQTRQALENLKTVLEAAGSGMDRVLKTTVYMIDLGAFAQMNEVYATFFPGVKPARAAIQIGALPKGAQVEIDAIAKL
jgi:2-iminobutanoate/2-iminopropanoate deaminase